MNNLTNHLEIPGFGLQQFGAPGFETTFATHASHPAPPAAVQLARYSEIGNLANYLLGKTWTNWWPARF